MQAIVTKFHGPTNFKGSRISAQCDGGRVIISSPDRLNQEDGHTLAAATLARKLGWIGDGYGCTMIRGGMPQSSPYAYVFVFSGNRTAEYDTVNLGDPKWMEQQ